MRFGGEAKSQAALPEKFKRRIDGGTGPEHFDAETRR